MKYIDADRLRTEIDRIEEEARKVRVSGTDKEAIGADGKVKLCLKLKSFIDSLQQEQPSLPSDLDEAAEEIVVKMHPCMEDCIILGDRLTRGELTALVKAGAELIISELFEKLKITPLKVIGKDEYGYPVYDFEVGHYYRTFTLFGEKYKCDQTDSGEAGEQMMAGQGYTTETKVDRTPLNGPAGICLNLHEYDGFKLGDKVIVQIRKKD